MPAAKGVAQQAHPLDPQRVEKTQQHPIDGLFVRRRQGGGALAEARQIHPQQAQALAEPGGQVAKVPVAARHAVQGQQDRARAFVGIGQGAPRQGDVAQRRIGVGQRALGHAGPTYP